GRVHRRHSARAEEPLDRPFSGNDGSQHHERGLEIGIGAFRLVVHGDEREHCKARANAFHAESDERIQSKRPSPTSKRGNVFVTPWGRTHHARSLAVVPFRTMRGSCTLGIFALACTSCLPKSTLSPPSDDERLIAPSEGAPAGPTNPQIRPLD